MNNRDTFEDRLENQAKARQALLERARAKDPTSDPEFAARQEARAAAARLREQREEERRNAKLAERAKAIADREAKKAEKIKSEAEEAKIRAEMAEKLSVEVEESGRAEVEAVLSEAQTGSAETILALLIIVYRLRNNLFHGEKWSYYFKDQLGNFTHASAILMRTVELFAVKGLLTVPG